MPTADNETGAGGGEDPGFESARDELVKIVSSLESGGLTLEQSLALWERGEYLADVCQRWLDAASKRLNAAANVETKPDGD